MTHHNVAPNADADVAVDADENVATAEIEVKVNTAAFFTVPVGSEVQGNSLKLPDGRIIVPIIGWMDLGSTDATADEGVMFEKFGATLVEYVDGADFIDEVPA